MIGYHAILNSTPGINAQVVKLSPGDARLIHSSLRFKADSLGEAFAFFITYCRHMFGLTVTLKDITVFEDSSW